MSDKLKPPDCMPTGIDGFDYIAHGGLPIQRTTLICGTTGSGKTLFATEFLWRGITRFQTPGVFITFEETPADIMTNVASLGWDLQRCVNDGTLVFVDASPRHDEIVEAGAYDLGALRARVVHAITTAKAKRVAIDSISSLFPQYSDTAMIRRELHRISSLLKDLGCTVVMTAERVEEYGAISRFGVEEFVTDNVIILRNLLERGRRRRSAEVLKFRGALHEKGEYPFTISSGGLKFFPLSAIELTQKSTTARINSGNPQIDEMCGGGFFRDSVILVSGPTGTGKTLMVTKFVEAAAAAGERCILFAFEESREQLLRNGLSWGVNLEQFEQEGLLRIFCHYPEARGLEDHLLMIESAVTEFKPQRVAVDSLSALERGVSDKAFREFVVALTAYLKRDQITGMFTNTTDVLLGSRSITETHISTITDTIIMLSYVELGGQLRRAMTIIKMRGSRHKVDIYEFEINDTGIHVREPFRYVDNLLTGNSQNAFQQERRTMHDLLDE